MSREEAAAYQRAYYQRTRDARVAYKRSYYQAHKDELRAKSREYSRQRRERQKQDALQALTREEVEEKIMTRLREIREIALAYSPEDDYLSMFWMGDHLSASNGPGARKPISCWAKTDSGTVKRV